MTFGLSSDRSSVSAEGPARVIPQTARRLSIGLGALLLSVVGLSVGCLSACASKTTTTYEPEADRSGIREVVRTHMKELRQCYYQTLEAHPASEGKVILAWDLDKDGKASGTHMQSIKGKRGIEHVVPCLVAKINSWQFPKPNANESTSIVYPLYFSENGKTDFDAGSTSDGTPKTATNKASPVSDNAITPRVGSEALSVTPPGSDVKPTPPPSPETNEPAAAPVSGKTREVPLAIPEPLDEPAPDVSGPSKR